jgi:hypothetical protein
MVPDKTCSVARRARYVNAHGIVIACDGASNVVEESS